jgi:hypothetical protein
MGVYTLMAPCFGCRKVFASNPHRVPSYKSEPICASCIVIVNARRKAAGLPLWPVPADAYEPVEEL